MTVFDQDEQRLLQGHAAEQIAQQSKQRLLAQIGVQPGSERRIGDFQPQQVAQQGQARRPLGINPLQHVLHLHGLLHGRPCTLQPKQAAHYLAPGQVKRALANALPAAEEGAHAVQHGTLQQLGGQAAFAHSGAAFDAQQLARSRQQGVKRLIQSGQLRFAPHQGRRGHLRHGGQGGHGHGYRYRFVLAFDLKAWEWVEHVALLRSEHNGLADQRLSRLAGLHQTGRCVDLVAH